MVKEKHKIGVRYKGIDVRNVILGLLLMTAFIE